MATKDCIGLQTNRKNLMAMTTNPPFANGIEKQNSHENRLEQQIVQCLIRVNLAAPVPAFLQTNKMVFSLLLVSNFWFLRLPSVPL